MKRKKLAALGLAVLMAFSTAACGSGSDSGSANSLRKIPRRIRAAAILLMRLLQKPQEKR